VDSKGHLPVDTFWEANWDATNEATTKMPQYWTKNKYVGILG